jgi:hypothetical protein
VTGHSFAARHKEHAKASKLTTSQHLDSRFYLRYHSKDVQLSTKGAREGFFENLLQYVACGIDRNVKVVQNWLTNDASKDGGLFHFNIIVKKKIHAVNIQGVTTLSNKQMHCVAYLTELTYNLCNYPKDNVSSNPGFETIIGVWLSMDVSNSTPSVVLRVLYGEK